MKKILSKTSFAETVFVLSVIVSGAFYEYVSCILSAAMLVWLIIIAVKEKKLKFNLNFTSAALLIISAFYLISFIWAVDRGMAFIGFLKFLPVLLYAAVLMQRDETEKIISHLPYIAAVITVVSAVLMQIPALYPFFSAEDRFSGFFQYPNTFALFLLVAEITVSAKDKLSTLNIITSLVLLFGILYTGSRTVLVLTVLSNIAVVFIVKNKAVKITVISELAAAAVGVGIYVLAAGGRGAIGRLISISFTQNGMLTRLLYYKDALTLIFKHPFGTGYMGYYYLQRSIQTGVYSVMYVHNDFLQLILDVGFIPFIAFVLALVRSFIKKGRPLYHKVILAVIAAHCCFDFDLQYICMFMLLIMFTERDGKQIILTKRVICAAVCAAATAVNIYTGVSLLLSRTGKYEAAQKLYPYNTYNESCILMLETDIKKAEKTADGIIKRNKYVSAAYSVKAKAAFSAGDFGSVIEYKNRVFEIAPFEYSEYEEYCYMMISGIKLYTEAADTESALICRAELLKAADTVRNFPDRLSKLGSMISDQPLTRLPDDITEYINSIK